jgi:hypothetical protein
MFRDNQSIDFKIWNFTKKKKRKKRKKKLTKNYKKTTNIPAPQNLVIEIIYDNVKFNLN